MTNKPSVLIIGLGLIGASFAKALKNANAAHVLGFDSSLGVPEQAVELGIIDEAVTSLSQLSQVDVILMAVPVMAIESVVEQLKHLLPELIALTDVGSVKGEVVRSVERALGYLPDCFIPGHPIAGAERSGLLAAKSDLFKNHMVILTPVPQSTETAIAVVKELWLVCGCQVVEMSVERHDEVLAATSHLPHLLAFSLVDTLARESENREIFKYAAGGFRDFSRIAASDPTMWHDIFLSNRDATLKILRRFQADLKQLEHAIEHNDGGLLKTVFARAKSARDYFTEILESRKK